MCRTNGLKKLYERELTMQSNYYGVFDALLRNFREAEAAEELNINTEDFQRMGKLILSDEQLYKDFRSDIYSSNTSHIYDKDRRLKRRQLSLVLYHLYREGVDSPVI